MADMEIQLPDGRILEVPEGTPKETIQRAVAKAMGAPVGLEAGAAGMGRGAALGFGDELRAAVRSAMPQISEWMMTPPSVGGATPSGEAPAPRQTVSQAPDAGRRYEEELAKARLEKKLSEAASPAWAKGGEIVGNVLTTAAATPGVVGTVGTALGRMLQLGTAGAIAGGVQGFGEGEGDAEARAKNAAIPALLGGVLGAASEPGSAIVRGLYQWAVPRALTGAANVLEAGAPQVANRSASAAGVTPTLPQDSLRLRTADFLRSSADDMVNRAAVAKIADDLAAGRLTPEEAQARVLRLGEQGMLIDVNPNLQRTARDSYILPGEGREVIDTALDARRMTEGARMRGAAGADSAPPLPQARQELADVQAATGAQAYGVALDTLPLQVSDRMRELLRTNPNIRAAQQAALDDAAANGITLSDARLAHETKRYLNLIAEGRINTGTAIDRDKVANTARQWEQALWDANDAIRQADLRYAQAGGATRRLDEGAQWMRSGTTPEAQAYSPYSLAQEVPGMTAGERQALAWGTQGAIREGTTSIDKTRSLVRALTRSDPQEGVTARLPHLIGPERADALTREAQIQALQTGAERAVRGGAVERAGDVQAAIGNLPQVGGAVPTDPRGLLARTADWFLDAAARARNPNELVRNELARRLVTTGDNRETLELARRLMDERLQRALLAPGVAAAAGSNAPNPF